MSQLDHPDDMEAPNIQVWNNAAFDNGDSEVTTCSLSNPSSKSLLTDCSKENLCPLSMNTPASLKYSVSEKPLRKPLKSPCIVSAKRYEIVKGKEERDIDEEIKETEREINRLSARLKALQIEKAGRITFQRGKRFVPMKSIELKLNPNGVESKMGENRGLSLGPSEIHAGAGVRRWRKTEHTPSRRQSCLPKLVDNKDEKMKNRRGNSMSLSPKSRGTLIKAQALRQSATSLVSKRAVKKDGVAELIQPKKLFKDIDKAAASSVKTPLRTGRVVASRYNQTNERRCSSELCRNKTPQTTVRKRWEIPTEILVLQQEMKEMEAPIGQKLNFVAYDEEE